MALFCQKSLQLARILEDSSTNDTRRRVGVSSCHFVVFSIVSQRVHQIGLPITMKQGGHHLPVMSKAQTPRASSSLLRGFLRTCAVCSALLTTPPALLSLLAFAAYAHWLLNLLDQIRPFLVLTAIPAPFLFLYFKQRIVSLFLGTVILVNFAVLAPHVFPGQKPAADAPRELAVTAWNIGATTADTGAVKRFLDAQDTDLLFIGECTPANLSAVLLRLDAWTLVHAEPRDDTQGVAVLMKNDHHPGLRVSRVQALHLPEESQRPLIEMVLESGHRQVAVLCVQTTRPASKGGAAFQQRELNAISEWARFHREAGRAVLLGGDFNSTPWSRRIRSLCNTANLQVAPTNVFSGTWPAGLPNPCRIPIDLVLFDEALTLLHCETLPASGSDHLPLRAQFALERQPPPIRDARTRFYQRLHLLIRTNVTPCGGLVSMFTVWQVSHWLMVGRSPASLPPQSPAARQNPPR